MPKKWIVAGLLVLALLAGYAYLAPDSSQPPASAQDDDDQVADLLETYTIRPIDDILDPDDLEITNFASDGSATLPLTTRVPVACTVVYGTDKDFGQLSVDQDMAGGAHSDHSPLLSGLEPETTYYFRVQGTDPDGVLYLSEIMTFTTPDFEAMAAQTDNLASPAMGATVTSYSSAFGDAAIDERWGAGNAFDDNPNTAWSSAGEGDEAWIEVELAQRARIEGVEFWTRAMSDGSAITLAFTITTEDGQTYGPFEIPDASQPYTFEVTIEAQTLRFDLIETTGGNTGVVDIAVYGEFIEDEDTAEE